LVDERLTTVTAHRHLHDVGRRERQHRAVVDQVAAVVILQAALDAERATGREPGQPVEVDGTSRRPRRKDRA
jgi:putative Holliday junction resolvase